MFLLLFEEGAHPNAHFEAAGSRLRRPEILLLDQGTAHLFAIWGYAPVLDRLHGLVFPRKISIIPRLGFQHFFVH